MQESLDPRIAELLAAKVAGEALPDDGSVELDAWLALPSNAARASLLADVRTVRYSSAYAGNPNAFAERINEQLNRGTAARPEYKKWLRVGAVLGAACLLVFAGPKLIERFSSSKGSNLKEYKTASGQIARFTLPDNSTIVLAPMSRIQ